MQLNATCVWPLLIQSPTPAITVDYKKSAIDGKDPPEVGSWLEGGNETIDDKYTWSKESPPPAVCQSMRCCSQTSFVQVQGNKRTYSWLSPRTVLSNALPDEPATSNLKSCGYKIQGDGLWDPGWCPGLRPHRICTFLRCCITDLQNEQLLAQEQRSFRPAKRPAL